MTFAQKAASKGFGTDWYFAKSEVTSRTLSQLLSPTSEALHTAAKAIEDTRFYVRTKRSKKERQRTGNAQADYDDAARRLYVKTHDNMLATAKALETGGKPAVRRNISKTLEDMGLDVSTTLTMRGISPDEAIHVMVERVGLHVMPLFGRSDLTDAMKQMDKVGDLAKEIAESAGALSKFKKYHGLDSTVKNEEKTYDALAELNALIAPSNSPHALVNRILLAQEVLKMVNGVKERLEQSKNPAKAAEFALNYHKEYLKSQTSASPQESAQSQAATIRPLARGASSQPVSMGKVENVEQLIEAHYKTVLAYAENYQKSGSKPSKEQRDQLNEMSLLLHAEIKVFSHTLPKLGEKFQEWQDEANAAIEAAAAAHGQKIEYKDIDSVSSSSGDSASKHIHGHLFHRSTTSADELKGRVEEKVREELKGVGYADPDRLLEWLFEVRSLHRAPATKSRKGDAALVSDE